MRRVRANPLAVAALLAVCAVQTGCTHGKDAVALAQQMTATANELSTYYGALAQCVNSELGVLELEQALNHEPLDAENVAQLQAVMQAFQQRQQMADALATLASMQAFQQRQQMADALATLASQLTTLTGSTAPASVGASVNTLASDMTGLKGLPLSSGTATAIPGAMSQSAQGLMQWWQTRKERGFARSFAKTADAMSSLFAREKPVYDSVVDTYDREAASVAIVLVKGGQISDDSLTAELAPALKPFGLSTGSMTAALRQQLQAAAPELLRRQAAQLSQQEQTASAALASNLTAVSQQTAQLAAGKPLGKVPAPASMTAVDAWTKTVQP